MLDVTELTIVVVIDICELEVALAEYKPPAAATIIAITTIRTPINRRLNPSFLLMTYRTNSFSEIS